LRLFLPFLRSFNDVQLGESSGGERSQWVNLDKTHVEHNMAAVVPIADM